MARLIIVCLGHDNADRIQEYVAPFKEWANTLSATAGGDTDTALTLIEAPCSHNLRTTKEGSTLVLFKGVWIRAVVS